MEPDGHSRTLEPYNYNVEAVLWVPWVRFWLAGNPHCVALDVQQCWPCHQLGELCLLLCLDFLGAHFVIVVHTDADHRSLVSVTASGDRHRVRWLVVVVLAECAFLTGFRVSVSTGFFASEVAARDHSLASATVSSVGRPVLWLGVALLAALLLLAGL